MKFFAVQSLRIRLPSCVSCQPCNLASCCLASSSEYAGTPPSHGRHFFLVNCSAVCTSTSGSFRKRQVLLERHSAGRRSNLGENGASVDTPERRSCLANCKNYGPRPRIVSNSRDA